MTDINLSSSRALAQALENFSKEAEPATASLDMGDVMTEFAVALRKQAAVLGGAGKLLGRGAGGLARTEAKLLGQELGTGATGLLGRRAARMPVARAEKAIAQRAFAARQATNPWLRHMTRPAAAPAAAAPAAAAAAPAAARTAPQGISAGYAAGPAAPLPRQPPRGIAEGYKHGPAGEASQQAKGLLERALESTNRAMEAGQRGWSSFADKMWGTARPKVDPKSGYFGKGGLYSSTGPVFGEGGMLAGSGLTAEQARIAELEARMGQLGMLGAGAGGMFLLDRALGGGGGGQPPNIIRYG